MSASSTQSGSRAKRPKSKTAVMLSAERLRARALAAEEGTFLGSEETTIANLSASRSTVRQAARIVERDGLIKVRRGINGGYFSARPDAATVEAAVSAYLESLSLDVEDATRIASALWAEVVKKAAAAAKPSRRLVAAEFSERVRKLDADASLAEVRTLELDSRSAIFKLANSGYIELFFNVNAIFASRRFATADGEDDGPEQREFVRTWRNAKLMELGAIRDGDVVLGEMAARHIAAFGKSASGGTLRASPPRRRGKTLARQIN